MHNIKTSFLIREFRVCGNKKIIILKINLNFSLSLDVLFDFVKAINIKIF